MSSDNKKYYKNSPKVRAAIEKVLAKSRKMTREQILEEARKIPKKDRWIGDFLAPMFMDENNTERK